MKKLVAICAFLALPFAIASCSSDDNVIRKKSDYEGTWVTDSLSYTIPNGPTMKHKFKDMPGGDDAITQDIMILTEDKATLVETTKKGVDQPAVQGVIKDQVITFNSGDPRHTPRTIVRTTDAKLTVVYDIAMRGDNLPVTVTYLRKN
ncbi:hypothetical protein [Myroides sp. DF42-4-2]|uniref:hypothetical protein n=1 Tax=unclassified Myroides TaxID=2642485 RepID=UPI00257495A1|nr:hypothetical protein [Myroides sp. DF42-4-2]MDM1408492.1 hypothetical protein [Myroides sp. DF42-4-2]